MAQIEGAYLHEKLNGTVYDIALYDSVSDVGDCYYQCGYRGQTAYIAATEDKTSEAYQKYGTPATFRRKDGTEFWLLTQPYLYYLDTTDIEDVPASGGTYDLNDCVDTNADSVAYEVTDGSGWLTISGVVDGGIGELIPVDVAVGDDTAVEVTPEAGSTLTVAANTGAARTGTVKVTGTFSDGSTLTGEITISQERGDETSVGGDVTIEPTPALTYTFTINPTPSDATVTINGTVQNSVTVESGTTVSWTVEKDGYVTQSGSETITDNTTKNVTLELQTHTFTISATPSAAKVTLNGTEFTGSGSVTVNHGSVVTWEVSLQGYVTQSGRKTVTGDATEKVSLEAIRLEVIAHTVQFDSGEHVYNMQDNLDTNAESVEFTVGDGGYGTDWFEIVDGYDNMIAIEATTYVRFCQITVHGTFNDGSTMTTSYEIEQLAPGYNPA